MVKDEPGNIVSMANTPPLPQQPGGGDGGGEHEILVRLVKLEQKIQHTATDLELEKISSKIDIGLSSLKIWILGSCLTAMITTIPFVIYLTVKFFVK